jgi:MFS family permease
VSTTAIVPVVSELLTAASSALDVPEPLVQRSAAARAAANGTSIDDVLAAWAGGAPVAAAAPPPAPVAAPVAAVEVAPETPAAMAEPAPAAAPVAAATAVLPEPDLEPETAPLEPIPLGRRVRTAVRVGAWTGAGLGLVGFVVASAGWSANATVTGEETFTTVIQADTNTVIIGAALVSLIFGAVAASLSRAAASWANPGMQLGGSAASTAWLGALVGLLLGVVAGAVLTSGFGTPVEGVEGVAQLPVLPTLAVMLIGGAVLGGLTAAITQGLGVPVAVPDEDGDEVQAVRHRLRSALSIPLTGLLLLLLLVLPFAWALIESNHLTSGGAAIVGILTASGILAFASLGGSRPNIKLSFGDVMVAVIGIGAILVFILAVLFARSPEEGAEEPPAETEAAAIFIVG